MSDSLRLRQLVALTAERKRPADQADYLDRCQALLLSAGFVARMCILHPAPYHGPRAVAVTVKAGDPRVRWTASTAVNSPAAQVPCALNYRPSMRAGEFVLYSGVTEPEVQGFTDALLDRRVQNSFPDIDLGPWDPHQPDPSLSDEIDAHFEILRAMHHRAFPFS
jgi:hypothetical protein